MGARVLVVDDEPSIVRVVATNLRAHGYEALTAASGEAALAMIETQQPDCIVLDLGLPGIDGLEVLRRLRTWAATPVVILTAVEDQRDRTTALDLGADDYVTKPFGVNQLLARLRAAVRRATPTHDQAPVVQTPDFRVDLVAKRVSTSHGEVRLTPTEWHLVDVLVRNRGKLVSQRQLL